MTGPLRRPLEFAAIATRRSGVSRYRRLGVPGTARCQRTVLRLRID